MVSIRAAAGQLHRFASIALKGPRQPVLGPGQYVYEETASRSLMVFWSGSTGISFRYFVPATQERWLGSDGSGRSDWVMGQPEFIADVDREAYERYVDSGALAEEWGRSGFEWGESGTTRYTQGELEFFDFSDLPTDVDVLKGMIERREIIGGPDGDWETFNLAGIAVEPHSTRSAALGRCVARGSAPRRHDPARLDERTAAMFVERALACRRRSLRVGD